MLHKYISKSFRSFGLFFIFSFATFCIFATLFAHDIDDSWMSNFLKYTLSFESRFYDYRMRQQLNPLHKSQQVALVEIDDYSLEKIGTWPIPRTLHAQMIQRLNEFGAKVVALDILYPEKAPVCGVASPDRELADAFTEFQKNGNQIFLAYTIGSDSEDSFQEVPIEMLNNTVLIRSSSQNHMQSFRVSRFTFPISELTSSNVGLASISMNEDLDGIFRQYLLVLNIDTIYFGSLGFNAWEAFTEKKHEVKIFDDGSGEIKLNNGKKIELNRLGETRIRFLGGKTNFSTIRLYDLLNARPKDQKIIDAIKNKIVFVGSTAMGAHDLRSSPIDPKMPGVFAHMNIAHMLLNGHVYQPHNESVKYSLIFLCLGMGIFFLVQKLSNAYLDLISLAFIVSACYAADYYYFLPEGYELKLFYCFFCFILSYSWNTFLEFSETVREKNQIRGTFARYVAPTIVDEMLQDPEKLVVGGIRRDITCLFSDVRDFTSISEGLSAQELSHSLNLYMGKMTDIVFETKGTLDKYIGDAIVAFWGAPLEIGNHAQFAVEGAIRMINLLPMINEEFSKLGRPQFNVGIGLNSGECNVGNMGSDRIFSYTALGDNMNLGARLEGLCKYYACQILISEYTLERLTPGSIKFRPIDSVIVKGKTRPVDIFEVIHDWHSMNLDTEALSQYLEGWSSFKRKDFHAALEIFNKILERLKKDIPSQRLRDLSQKYIDRPEMVDNYFDVTKMTEK